MCFLEFSNFTFLSPLKVMETSYPSDQASDQGEWAHLNKLNILYIG